MMHDHGENDDVGKTTPMTNDDHDDDEEDGDEDEDYVLLLYFSMPSWCSYKANSLSARRIEKDEEVEEETGERWIGLL